jgi:hypothetical protein
MTRFGAMTSPRFDKTPSVGEIPSFLSDFRRSPRMLKLASSASREQALEALDSLRSLVGRPASQQIDNRSPTVQRALFSAKKLRPRARTTADSQGALATHAVEERASSRSRGPRSKSPREIRRTASARVDSGLRATSVSARVDSGLSRTRSSGRPAAGGGAKPSSARGGNMNKDSVGDMTKEVNKLMRTGAPWRVLNRHVAQLALRR